MKILVTGAGGYLGQGVVKKLLDDGIHVIAADLKDSNIDKRAEIKCCDIFKIDNNFEYFDKPDVLLHMAWKDGFIHNSLSHINDLPKHIRFIKELVESGVKRVAVMGSMHEVGFHEGSINENTACNPLSFYGIGKNALRNAVSLIAKDNNIDYQWLRGFYIVGNTEYGSSIFSKITAAVKAGKQEFPFTMGENQFDFIDYSDFCIKVATAVEQNKIDGIINICQGKPEKLADRVERFIRDNGYNIKLQYGVYPDRPYDSKAVWGDAGRISIIMNNKYRRE